MKANKFHLENLYQSPRNHPNTQSTRKIYSNGAVFSKTSRNNNDLNSQRVQNSDVNDPRNKYDSKPKTNNDNTFEANQLHQNSYTNSKNDLQKLMLKQLNLKGNLSNDNVLQGKQNMKGCYGIQEQKRQEIACYSDRKSTQKHNKHQRQMHQHGSRNHRSSSKLKLKIKNNSSLNRQQKRKINHLSLNRQGYNLNNQSYHKKPLTSGRSPTHHPMLSKSATKYSLTSRMNSSPSTNNKIELMFKQKNSAYQNSTKSTMMMAELQNATIRMQKLKQNKKLHSQGKNCRVIVIQGTNEQEHYIVVSKISDIMTYLKKQLPRYKYYKSIPSQLTMDFILMEGHQIDGKFLNGQSLYLKPCMGNSSNINIHNQISQLDQINGQARYTHQFSGHQSSNAKVTLNSFEIIKNIGSGGFSKVFLTRFKQDGQFYAMKIIDKQTIVKNKKKRIIANQRNIMKSSEHAFVIDMKFAFETQKFLIFVMQYCPGGELFNLIKKYRRVEQSLARFYIIEIFLGLAYLHQQKVIYRDIKPENILLCQNGHVKIADLGLAKPNMFQGQLAYSFCGSPEYMSPQMILQVGHTFPVDYYCMGALLYELLAGLPPFYSRDPNEIYQAVLSEDLTFPEDLSLTNECKSLLKSLLNKDPKHRLGSLYGVKEILAHPWFGKNSYKKFTAKQVDPPLNFMSIGKLQLDNYQNQQKNKKQVEEIKKQQKLQRKKFKEVMKDFYYDFRTKQQQKSLNQERQSKINNISNTQVRNLKDSSKQKNIRISCQTSRKNLKSSNKNENSNKNISTSSKKSNGNSSVSKQNTQKSQDNNSNNQVQRDSKTKLLNMMKSKNSQNQLKAKNSSNRINKSKQLSTKNLQNMQLVSSIPTNSKNLPKYNQQNQASTQSGINLNNNTNSNRNSSKKMMNKSSSSQNMKEINPIDEKNLFKSQDENRPLFKDILNSQR